jgi:hypothetical protein
MRKGMTGLAMLVQQRLAEDPFSDAVSNPSAITSKPWLRPSARTASTIAAS